MALNIKRFVLEFNPWEISWPAWYGRNTTIRLPVTFNLELGKGSKKEDCAIWQTKKGLVEGKSVTTDRFATATLDGGYWWDGRTWSGGGEDPSWDASGSTATFFDLPGFQKIQEPAYPLYYGGINRPSSFEFETFVGERADLRPVLSLKWGFLIDVRAPLEALCSRTFNGFCSDDGTIGRHAALSKPSGAAGP